MDTLQDLSTAIGTVTDIEDRANLWLRAGAQHTNKGNYITAVTMLVNSRELVANFMQAGSAKNYLVSQLAYEFARARDTDKAKNALAYIEDSEIKDTTRARIAVQASKYNVNIANDIVGTITDILIRDNAITNVAYERAKLGNLNEALTIANQISDAQLIPTVRREVIKYSSEVIT